MVSVEVNFYPKYRDYYSLFNDGGVVGDIVTAEEEMLAVLNRELRFTASSSCSVRQGSFHWRARC